MRTCNPRTRQELHPDRGTFEQADLGVSSQRPTEHTAKQPGLGWPGLWGHEMGLA